MKIQKSFQGKNLDKMVSFIQKLKLDKDSTYQITVIDERLISQNAIYNIRVRELSNYMGIEFKDMKRILKLELGLCEKFQKDGEWFVEFHSTSDLNVDEMSHYLEQINQWAIAHNYTFKEFQNKIGLGK